jgi:glyoxylase-like metal-dependent hydrolase (beta-lactamase superfamily II)
MQKLSRRTVLKSSAALAALGVAPRAFAATPMANVPLPSAYRFKVGHFECTAVSDGALNLGAPKPEMFKGYTQERIDELLDANFIDKTNVVADENALVINTGEKLVLIDTGMGKYKMFGNNAGRLVSNLKSGGIDPAAIDAVILSHAHPDHCWGLVGESGAPNFPNAQIYLTQADLEFWTDPGKASDPMLGGLIGPTRDTLLPLRDRIAFIKDGQEVMPGITAIATPGHTIGHTSFVITSEGKSLVYIADLAHQWVLTMENPRAEFVFDTDPQQAISSRLRVFEMVAAQRMPIIAYHFPWPGIGYLAKRGEGYRYVAARTETAF